MTPGLNPALWDRNDELNPKVREALLLIAEDFYKDHIKIPGEADWDAVPEVLDILLVGSNAGYGWNQHSDIDLHLVLNFSEVSQNIEMVRDYFDAKRALFNQEHDLTIRGLPVELYCQNVGEKLQSQGQYSVMWGRWITRPHVQPSSNRALVRVKTKRWMAEIERVLQIDDPKELLAVARKLKLRLKRYRQAGLTKHGEFGAENLAYKALRNLGLIDKLFSAWSKAFDAVHSLA